MKTIPICNKPIERFLSYGEGSLSDIDLLSNILRSGTKQSPVSHIATEIIQACDGKIRNLSTLTLNELLCIDGIGITKAVQILSLVEIARRMSLPEEFIGQQFNSPELVADYMSNHLQFELVEKFLIVHLDSKNRIITFDIISIGTINATLVQPRELFKLAIKRMACSIICVHNHPSGDVTPSAEDLKLTEKIVKTGRIIGIQVLDHIIVSKNKNFCSINRSYPDMWIR